VLTNVKALLDEEVVRLKALRQATNAAEVRAACSGHTYTQAKKQKR
jgi:hypothetical protein